MALYDHNRGSSLKYKNLLEEKEWINCELAGVVTL
jgi:hypothetical protein